MDDPQVISMTDDPAAMPPAPGGSGQETLGHPATPSDEQASAEQTSAASTTEVKPEAPPSEAVQKLTEQMKQLGSEAEQIALGMQFMQEALTAAPRPRFKDFWDARRALVALVKTDGRELSAEVTAQLHTLGQEARKLKNQLDEKATATLANMEAGVQAIEVDVHHLAEAVRATPELDALPESLKERHAEYLSMQREAAVMSHLAQRITASRKEVLATEMRIRHKNQLLTRLSAAGDKVYPRRKELIGQLSQWFEEDVRRFIDAHFKSPQIQGMLNAHREEIKALQQVSKHLSLNAVAFNKTRQMLGEAWDRVKQADAERKKHRQERIAATTHVEQALQEKLTELDTKVKEQLEGAQAAAPDVERLKGEALALLRGAPLGREQVKTFKDRIFNAVRPLEAKDQQVRDEKKRVIREQEDAYRKRVDAVATHITEAEQRAAQLSAEELGALIQGAEETLGQQNLLLADQEQFRRRITALRDPLLHARAQQAQEETVLQDLIQEVKKRRQQLRHSIDDLRRSRGGSALDVSKGLEAEAQLAAEKGRLDQINQLLYELESRIYSMQQQG